MPARHGKAASAVDEALLRQSFELNFFAHQRIAQAAVKIILAQGVGGCLLFNVSKQAVRIPVPISGLTVCRAATLFLSRQYALDYGKDGVAPMRSMPIASATAC